MAAKTAYKKPMPIKKQRGILRLMHAFAYSMSGLRFAWLEPAFRQEAMVALVCIPAAFWLGQNWIEIALLCGVLIFVLVVELLNTAIESAIDRIGPQWHDLSKRAKDLGSAAVLLSLVLCAVVWGTALWLRVLHV